MGPLSRLFWLLVGRVPPLVAPGLYRHRRDGQYAAVTRVRRTGDRWVVWFSSDGDRREWGQEESGFLRDWSRVGAPPPSDGARGGEQDGG